MKADESVKYGMYPEQTEPEDKHKAMYVRTHGSWAPGEQITRGYNWKVSGVGVWRRGVQPLRVLRAARR